jgi:hypothetical protein
VTRDTFFSKDAISLFVLIVNDHGNKKSGRNLGCDD